MCGCVKLKARDPERIVLPLGDLAMTKKARRKLRARAVALARLIGSVQLVPVVARLWLYRYAMLHWGTAVSRHRSVRVEALMAALVPADGSLRRRVWLRLVGNFAIHTASSRGVGQIALEAWRESEEN